MISVYDIGDINYSTNGDAVLFPTECIAKEVAGGSYEVTIKHPLDPFGKWKHLVAGAIVKVPVPVTTTEAIIEGDSVDIWVVTSNSGAPVYSQANAPTRITYQNWTSATRYSAGAKVTFQNQNYQLSSVSSPYNYSQPGVNPAWVKISNYTSGSSVLTTLATGAEMYLMEDYNTSWVRIQTYQGIEGYVQKANAQFDRTETVEPVEPREVREQLFRIYNVQIQSDQQMVNVNARHVSYDLSGNLLDECKLVNIAPSTALARIRAALLMPIDSTIATNLTEADNGTYTNDLSFKNGIYALLDPDKGMVAYFHAKLVRDNWDIFIYKLNIKDRGFRISYGKNLQGVNWQRKSDGIINRIVPTAKAADGSTLYLSPTKWVDSPILASYPVVYMQRLNVDGQVGKDDGDGGTWTEATLRAHMQSEAEKEFSVKHVDGITSKLTVTFTELGETEEYKQYRGLNRVFLYDTVKVYHPDIGLDEDLQVSETEWDCIMQRYRSITLGDVFDYGKSTVAGYSIGDGAIDYVKLSQETVDKIRAGVEIPTT